jgi:hypothetical protein
MEQYNLHSIGPYLDCAMDGEHAITELIKLISHIN